MPNSPNRKRGRIGLTLAPDVMDILDEHGRMLKPDADDPELTPDENVRRWSKLLDAWARDKRPTRTEIIEEAVREWKARRK